MGTEEAVYELEERDTLRCGPPDAALLLLSIPREPQVPDDDLDDPTL